jgi:hypothetical protein
MERMGSRQGLFPRLRNLINPLDSQSMMDRAQGTKVGTASPAPLSYSKRLFPSTTGGPATGAPKVGGKAAPSNPAQEDLASLKPPAIGDLEAQFADAQGRARIARARAEVQTNPELRAQLIQEATYYERQAQQVNNLFTQKGVADSLKPKPALTGQFESQEDVERRLRSGQTTPAAGAQAVHRGLQASREAPYVGQAADLELQGLTRQLTMPYVAGQMSMGQMPVPGTALGAQFQMALDTLPPEQRQTFVTASLGPELQKDFISRVQAAAIASGAPPLDMEKLTQGAAAYSQGQLAKIDPTFYGESKSGSMLKFFGDAATGAKQMLGQVLPQPGDVARGASNLTGDISQGGSKLVEQIMGRPAVNAAPPASIPPLLPAAPMAAPAMGDRLPAYATPELPNPIANPTDVFTEGPFKGRKRPKVIPVK